MSAPAASSSISAPTRRRWWGRLSLPEGRLLLSDLLEHATQRQFVYRHEWRPGDLVMWDNRAVLHRGQRYDLGQKRDMRRSTVEDAIG